jgi:hypothetical protein
MVNVGRVAVSRRLGAQLLKVPRRSGGWVNGEFVENTAEELVGIYGLVTIAQPRDLQQIPEGDRITGAIRVLTNVRLLQTRDDGLGDIITWQGAQYKVSTVSHDIDYGFYRSICTRLEGD